MRFISTHALLGSTWIIWRASGALQTNMRIYTKVLGIAMLALFGIVGIWSPMLDPAVLHRWFASPGILATAIAPVIVIILAYFFFIHLKRADVARHDKTPFLCALGWFVVSFAGLGYSMFLQILPPSIDIWQAAAPAASQEFLIFGVVVIIPIIIAYNVFAYYVFRGKIEPGAHYH